MPEIVNLMKLTVVDQRLGLGYKPKNEDYRWATGVRIE